MSTDSVELEAAEPSGGPGIAAPSLRVPDGPAPVLVLVGEDEALLEVALDVTTRGFETARGFFDSLFDSKMRADGLDLWLAYVGDQPVSTALGLVTGDAVGIYDVGTPPEHRRKGYGAWATAQAVRGGFETGASFAYLQSSEMGFGVYEKLGFEQVAEYVLLTRPDAPESV